MIQSEHLPLILRAILVLQPGLFSIESYARHRHNASRHIWQVARYHHYELSAGADASHGELAGSAVLHSAPCSRKAYSNSDCVQVATGSESTMKEEERLRLKQMSEDRASKWPNTLQVGNRMGLQFPAFKLAKQY